MVKNERQNDNDQGRNRAQRLGTDLQRVLGIILDCTPQLSCCQVVKTRNYLLQMGKVNVYL